MQELAEHRIEIREALLFIRKVGQYVQWRLTRVVHNSLEYFACFGKSANGAEKGYEYNAKAFK